MEEFLRALYDDLPDGAWWYLWSLSPEGSKTTYWLCDAAMGAELATGLRGVNVYYPIAWASDCGTADQRITEANVAGIVGLVADIDFRDDTHRHAPEAEPFALELIKTFPLQPTACINSGHGLQCVWLFNEPWVLTTDEERRAAKSLSGAWGHTLSSYASKLGYGLDAVHDLARVMRLPGTLNVKREPHLLVQLRWLEHDLRYNPSDFDEWLIEYIPGQSPQALPVIDISTHFPAAKVEAMCEADSQFADTWEHRRKDFVDSSCSAYDMSLASQCVLAGLTDDEIAAVLRENQRRHGDKPQKVNDTRYFAKTIAKARGDRRHEEAREHAREVLEDPDSTREDDIRGLAARLEIPLTNIQRIDGDPAMLRFWVGGRCAEVPATDMVTQSRFLAQITSAANFYPRPAGPKDKPSWRELVNTMLRIAEPIEAGEDATVEGEFKALVGGFLDGRVIVDVPPGELLPGDGPFMRDGRTWFRLEHLAQYIRVFDSRVGRRILAQRLKALGAVQKHHKLQGRGGRQTTARFYGVILHDIACEVLG